MNPSTVLILGSHEGGYPLHESTREALHHAAGKLRLVINTRWMGVDELLANPGCVTEANAVVLAPPGSRPRHILPVSVLDALTLARERDVPFLATGEFHGLVFIEVARRVLGMANANSTFFDDRTPDPVVHDLENRPPIVATDGTWNVEIEIADDPLIAPLYGSAGPWIERTTSSHGLNTDYAQALTEVGFRPAAMERGGNRPWIHVLEGRRFHVTCPLLPQLQSSPSKPHPLFRGLVAAAATRE